MDNKTKKLTDEIEKNLNKKIDDEINLENEIKEVANHAANQLSSKPIATMEIQGARYLLAMKQYTNVHGKPCVNIASRKIVDIVTQSATVTNANAELDMQYTLQENIVTIIKGLLGHYTGLIKPEELD